MNVSGPDQACRGRDAGPADRAASAGPSVGRRCPVAPSGPTINGGSPVAQMQPPPDVLTQVGDHRLGAGVLQHRLPGPACGHKGPDKVSAAKQQTHNAASEPAVATPAISSDNRQITRTDCHRDSTTRPPNALCIAACTKAPAATGRARSCRGGGSGVGTRRGSAAPRRARRTGVDDARRQQHPVQPGGDDPASARGNKTKRLSDSDCVRIGPDPGSRLILCKVWRMSRSLTASR